MLQTLSIIVSGRVQGVFFRKSTKEIALSLGIKGTVCNQQDGTVKIIATGTEEQLNELLDWCKKGPAHAKVNSLKTIQISLESFTDFSIKYSS